MKEISYTITDPQGIHARPAGLFVKCLTEFTSKAVISRGDDRCEGKLLALMKMRVKAGETIAVSFEGEDEDAAAAAALAFLTEHL
jgi:phosphocarrier protein